MYRASCTVYYPEPTQMHYIYIYLYNIVCIVSTPTCFSAFASFSGSLNFVLVLSMLL